MNLQPARSADRIRGKPAETPRRPQHPLARARHDVLPCGIDRGAGSANAQVWRLLDAHAPVPARAAVDIHRPDRRFVQPAADMGGGQQLVVPEEIAEQQRSAARHVVAERSAAGRKIWRADAFEREARPIVAARALSGDRGQRRHGDDAVGMATGTHRRGGLAVSLECFNGLDRRRRVDAVDLVGAVAEDAESNRAGGARHRQRGADRRDAGHGRRDAR